jgi:hypothetical protein
VATVQATRKALKLWVSSAKPEADRRSMTAWIMILIDRELGLLPEAIPRKPKNPQIH